MNIRVLGRTTDECFRCRRLRSAGAGGIAGGAAAIGLFDYRQYHHLGSPALLAVAVAVVAVKTDRPALVSVKGLRG